MDNRDIIIKKQRDKIELLEEKNHELEKLLTPTVYTPLSWQLTTQESALFSLLLARERASIEQAFFVVTNCRNTINKRRTGDVSEQHVYVVIYKIRRKLARFGVKIKNEWGLGWRLVDRKSWRARLTGSEQDGRV